MDYMQLGQSGLTVSKFVLGTLTFSGTKGFEPVGNTNAADATRLVDLAMEAGVNTIDTANLYSMGDAEEVLGAALKGRRHDVIVCSKAGFPTSDRPQDRGAGRRHLAEQVEGSLRRIGTDYLDLYYVHLWDGQTPVEETCAAMSELVRAGKIRHWGVSNYSGWSLAKTMTVAKAGGYEPPIAHQILYNADAREAEYEILPAADDLGISSMVWSPLSMGLLSGKVDRDTPPPQDSRQGAEGWAEPYVANIEKLYDVIDALKAVAKEADASVAEVALAWVRDRPAIGPIVIGARNEDQLKDNLAAFDLKLSDAQIDRIEKAGRPPALYPHWHRAMHAADRGTPLEQIYLRKWRESQGLD